VIDYGSEAVGRYCQTH